jgi:hypothetical protein
LPQLHGPGLVQQSRENTLLAISHFDSLLKLEYVNTISQQAAQHQLVSCWNTTAMGKMGGSGPEKGGTGTGVPNLDFKAMPSPLVLGEN